MTAETCSSAVSAASVADELVALAWGETDAWDDAQRQQRLLSTAVINVQEISRFWIPRGDADAGARQA